jgi:predicted transcriptional regulator
VKRVQIYLTDEEKEALRQIAARSGRSQSELIQEAIDAYILKEATNNKAEILANAAGLWRDRQDLPDFAELRASWDREFAPMFPNLSPPYSRV